MDKEYAAIKSADELITALLDGKIYQTNIDKPTYDVVYGRLKDLYPRLRPSIFLLRGTATVQFSGISAATLVVSGNRPLTRESFATDCAFKEGAESLRWWPKALISDVFLLGWYLLIMCPLGTLLLMLQSPEDLHSYFILIAQVLAIVFTLYAVLRRSFKSLVGKEFPDYELDRVYQAERVIGVTAIGSIAVCLLEFLLTSSSATHWDENHVLTIGSIHLLLLRWASIFIGVCLIALLASFFRSIVFYYPDKEFGQTLLRVRAEWFEEQHTRARGITDERSNNHNI